MISSKRFGECEINIKITNTMTDIEYITWEEAAKELGVPVEIIESLCKKRVIPYLIEGNSYVISRDTLDRYATDILDIDIITHNIARIKSTLRKKERELERMRANVVENLEELEIFPESMITFKYLLLAIVNHNRMGLSPREVEVLKRKMEGKSNKSIGEDFNLSEETIRKIWKDSVQKIQDAYDLIPEQ